MSRGILYIAVGEKFVSEAETSVQSVRQQMPDINTTLATDSKHSGTDAFDNVIEMDNAQQKSVNNRTWLMNSVPTPELIPYDKTLYLDSDTYVCEDVSELFDLLNQYDLAIARVPNQPQVNSIPEPWHLYNCGVIAYRDSQPTRDLLLDWDSRYQNKVDKQDQPEDQPAFVEALYHNKDIRWYTLPREYNVRIPRRGSLATDPKIIHGRHSAGLEYVYKKLSEVDRLRVFYERSYWSDKNITVKKQSLRYRLEQSISNDGIIPTLRKAINRVLYDDVDN